jgi:hypothetical protein
LQPTAVIRVVPIVRINRGQQKEGYANRLTMPTVTVVRTASGCVISLFGSRA